MSEETSCLISILKRRATVVQTRRFRPTVLLRPLCLTVVLGIVSASPVAIAAPADDKQVNALFLEARDAEERGEWDLAIDRFREIQKSRNTPSVEYHIGFCLQQKGRLVEALASFEKSLEMAKPRNTTAVIELATKSIAELRAIVPRVSIEIAPKDRPAKVVVDERVRPELSNGGEVVLDPGGHRVEVYLSGMDGAIVDRYVTTKLRKVETIRVARPYEPEPYPVYGYVAIGSTVLLAGLGVLAYQAAGNAAEESKRVCAGVVVCDQSRADGVRRLDGIAAGLWIGAAIGLGASVGITVHHFGKSKGPSLVIGPNQVALQGTLP